MAESFRLLISDHYNRVSLYYMYPLLPPHTYTRKKMHVHPPLKKRKEKRHSYMNTLSVNS